MRCGTLRETASVVLGREGRSGMWAVRAGTVMGIVCVGCLGHMWAYRMGGNVRHCLSDLGLMVSEANRLWWSELDFVCLWSCVVADVRHLL